MSLTPTSWFPGDVMPVRNGVYDRTQPGGPCEPEGFLWFARWHDGVWFEAGPTPQAAARSTTPSRNQLRPNKRWRGLMKADA